MYTPVMLFLPALLQAHQGLNVKPILLTVLMFPIYAWPIEAMDNYYANDLLDAVDKAKQDPHHYDYSKNYRYKRTTAQSIHLNRLDLEELDETRVDIAPNQVESIAQGPLDQENPSFIKSVNGQEHSLSNDIFSKDRKITSIRNTNSLFLDTSHSNNMGNYTTTGIEQNGTLVTTPRP